jgi:hypothetical protein
MKLILLSYVFIFNQITSKDFTSYFYGNVQVENMAHNVNFLSNVRDQNQPHFCDVSQVFAFTTAMSVQYNKVFNNGFPNVVLSPQTAINCAKTQYSCERGAKDQPQPEELLEFLTEEGLGEEGCNNYHGNVEQKCKSENKCFDCSTNENIHNVPICFATRYLKYKLKSSGKVTSDKESEPAKLNDKYNQIQEQLRKSGPLACKLVHKDGLFLQRNHSSFDKVFEEKDDSGENTYETWMALVGYEKTENGEAWIL